jgi:hypothetical protein
MDPNVFCRESVTQTFPRVSVAIPEVCDPQLEQLGV